MTFYTEINNLIQQITIKQDEKTQTEINIQNFENQILIKENEKSNLISEITALTGDQGDYAGSSLWLKVTIKYNSELDIINQTQALYNYYLSQISINNDFPISKVQLNIPSLRSEKTPVSLIQITSHSSWPQLGGTIIKPEHSVNLRLAIMAAATSAANESVGTDSSC